MTENGKIAVQREGTLHAATWLGTAKCHPTGLRPGALNMRHCPVRTTLARDLCHRVPAISAPPGGGMVVIALLLPILLVVMMFALDALENFLFPQHTERSQTGTGNPSKLL
ncbi:hypothetical protein ACFQ8C_35440 [Streptomyces sp. NPDC056503]|uniref:hypothetical protein n=1 Tax=Streptomyces sp. NPDC056503 TaxID=3345842 RepID=UPI0036CD6C42